MTLECPASTWGTSVPSLDAFLPLLTMKQVEARHLEAETNRRIALCTLSLGPDGLQKLAGCPGPLRDAREAVQAHLEHLEAELVLTRLAAVRLETFPVYASKHGMERWPQ